MDKIKNLLAIIKAKIEAHNEFKKEYNKQLAFDFNVLNFFNVGENKTSEILAFFLNPEGNHGQDDAFLQEFMNYFKFETQTNEGVKVFCEKRIDENRRIDLYLEFKNKEILAIENKIWAKDQQNQLHDYSVYLEKVSNDKYLLLYLNPYNHLPSQSSISENKRIELENKKNFKVISYTKHVFFILDRWISISKADNVTFFLKQFRKYLEIKFLGNNTLKITKAMEDIIYKNQREVEVIINTYNNLSSKSLNLFYKISTLLQKEEIKCPENIIIEKIAPFPYEGKKVFKFGISKGGNKIYIQFIWDKINLFSHYYIFNTSDNIFVNCAENLKFNDNYMIPFNSNESEIIVVIMNQLKLAFELFAKYDEITSK